MDTAQEAKQYEEHYLDDWYGMGKARKADVVRLLTEHKADSLLDIGTGRGEALDIAMGLGFEVADGTETVDYLCNDSVKRCYSNDLPYPDDSYDLVTCFDVMEHLIEDDLKPTIREMVRTAKHKVIVSASEKPFVFKGVDQHISSRPASEWEQLFIEAAPGCTVERCGNAGDSPAWLITKGQ